MQCQKIRTLSAQKKLVWISGKHFFLLKIGKFMNYEESYTIFSKLRYKLKILYTFLTQYNLQMSLNFVEILILNSHNILFLISITNNLWETFLNKS